MDRGHPAGGELSVDQVSTYPTSLRVGHIGLLHQLAIVAVASSATTASTKLVRASRILNYTRHVCLSVMFVGGAPAPPSCVSLGRWFHLRVCRWAPAPRGTSCDEVQLFPFAP